MNSLNYRKLARSVKRFPRIYLYIARQKYNRSSRAAGLGVKPRVVHRSSDLVIEGPARSGNTFSVFAFRSTQKRHVDLAHHIHAAAQIRAAADWGIPAILLLREPQQCILSSAATFSRTTIREALLHYIDFMTDVECCIDYPVVVSFEEVTHDFGLVVDQMNERFGVDFARFDHTKANVSAVFSEIADQVGSAEFALPSLAREELKDQFLQELFSTRNVALLDQARVLYRRNHSSMTSRRQAG